MRDAEVAAGQVACCTLAELMFRPIVVLQQKKRKLIAALLNARTRGGGAVVIYPSKGAAASALEGERMLATLISNCAE
jgi:hypothetical protein